LKLSDALKRRPVVEFSGDPFDAEPAAPAAAISITTWEPSSHVQISATTERCPASISRREERAERTQQSARSYAKRRCPGVWWHP
jgi:hypothetical protein